MCVDVDVYVYICVYTYAFLHTLSPVTFGRSSNNRTHVRHIIMHILKYCAKRSWNKK